MKSGAGVVIKGRLAGDWCASLEAVHTQAGGGWFDWVEVLILYESCLPGNWSGM